METFKLVVDGIDLTAEERRQIEKGIEKVLLETAGKAGAGAGGDRPKMLFKPFPKEVKQVRDGIRNGGWLLRADLARTEREALVKSLEEREFGSAARQARADTRAQG
ncbi:MAG TPA: hypothetical protein VFS64_04615 [Solirubrobacterales bacterium]|nr:hypothetical protein [Solirubrobacterales bacterium]